jgi:hypothetical protein
VYDEQCRKLLLYSNKVDSIEAKGAKDKSNLRAEDILKIYFK